jgi:hypothetical protein
MFSIDGRDVVLLGHELYRDFNESSCFSQCANIELLFFLIQMSFKKLEGNSGQENSPTIYQSFSQVVVWASSF